MDNNLKKLIPDFRFKFQIEFGGPGFMNRVHEKLKAVNQGNVIEENGMLIFYKPIAKIAKDKGFSIIPAAFGKIKGTVINKGDDIYEVEIKQVTYQRIFIFISVFITSLILKGILSSEKSWFDLLKCFGGIYIFGWLFSLPNPVAYKELKQFFLDEKD